MVDSPACEQQSLVCLGSLCLSLRPARGALWERHQLWGGRWEDWGVVRSCFVCLLELLLLSWTFLDHLIPVLLTPSS